MSEHIRDRVIGSILFVFAVAWCVAVRLTVPEGYGGGVVGARDMPFWLGVSLAALSLVLVTGSFFNVLPAAGPAKLLGQGGRTERSAEWWAIALVAGSLVGYLLLMEWFGFVPATVLFVAGLLRLALGVRSIAVIGGMSLGLAFGVYLVMGVLMGVYLPHGTVIALF